MLNSTQDIECERIVVINIRQSGQVVARMLSELGTKSQGLFSNIDRSCDLITYVKSDGLRVTPFN